MNRLNGGNGEDMISTKQMVERVVVVVLFAGASILVGKVFVAPQTQAADSSQSSAESGLGSDLPLHDTVKVLSQLAAGIDSNLDSDE